MSNSETNQADSAAAISPDRPAVVAGISVGDYLIKRLMDFGVRDMFGIPGDYVLAFYTQLEKSPNNPWPAACFVVYLGK